MVTIVNRNDPMDVRDLQVFLSVAKHLNYTRAAEEVNLSQPSVSVRMRELERDLGSKLFEQLGKKIALTEAGQLLVPYATRIIAAMSDAQQAIDELQGLERGLLRIGASTTPGMYLIPRTVAHFKRRYPKTDMHLAVKDDVLPWRTDHLILVVPSNHPLARNRSVKTADLRKERFILREAGSATRAAVANHLQKADLKVETVMEMENPESVKKAVQSGLGIAFISKFAVETELKARSLVAINVNGLDINRELKIVYRKDKHLGRAAQTFIDMAQQ